CTCHYSYDESITEWSKHRYHLHLIAAARLLVDRGRRLHLDERQELKDMVLDDVAHRPGLLVIAGPLLDPDRLRHRDLHVVDVLAVPDRLEDPVRETQDEDVLDGLLAQVMVDEEHLVVAENGVDHRVERPCRLAVV